MQRVDEQGDAVKVLPGGLYIRGEGQIEIGVLEIVLTIAVCIVIEPHDGRATPIRPHHGGTLGEGQTVFRSKTARKIQPQIEIASATPAGNPAHRVASKMKLRDGLRKIDGDADNLQGTDGVAERYVGDDGAIGGVWTKRLRAWGGERTNALTVGCETNGVTTCIGVEFTEDNTEWKQGDKFQEKTIPFVFLDRKSI